ncbi:unnamed protein product, partial [Didymodactylos carnosus]
ELNEHEKTIEFLSKWLLLLDENDSDLYENCTNKQVWLLSHIYTSFEYDKNDLLSLYNVCRILNHLDSTLDFYTIKTKKDDDDDNNNNENELRTRSNVRDQLFILMFDYLWKHLCLPDRNHQQWIEIYTFITKYYPSDKVLQRIQLTNIKSKIEFMNLAYLIFLNDKTPEPNELVFYLLTETKLVNNENNDNNCSKLQIIIDAIQKYFETKQANCSISILKASSTLIKQEMNYLFKYLNSQTCQLSLAMKQFLFNEVANIYIERSKPIRKSTSDLTSERISILLPVIIECLTDIDNILVQKYQFPYHPSVENTRQNQTLLDLYFFYVRRYLNDEVIKYDFINKIMLLKIPTQIPLAKRPIADYLFKQLKIYISLYSTEIRLLHTIIEDYLKMDQKDTPELNKNVELFLSIIIAKKSWIYLLQLLKSDSVQRVNNLWANNLHTLLKTNETVQMTKYLHLCHQIQFTLSPLINENQMTSIIFPKLHQPYDELSKIVDSCTKDNIEQQCWTPLINWLRLKLDSNPHLLEKNEIKTMLLLKIYYT